MCKRRVPYPPPNGGGTFILFNLKQMSDVQARERIFSSVEPEIQKRENLWD